MVMLQERFNGDYDAQDGVNVYGAVSMGTTLIAAKYNGGICVGTDTRTSSGSLIVCRISDKITEVTKYISVLRSGSSADTQAITDIVKYHVNFYEMEHNKQVPVHIAAQVFRDMAYRYRDDLSAGLIVCGWDPYAGGQIYSVPIGGMILRQPWAAGGSGSTFVYGFLDEHFRENMNREQCTEFVTKAVAHAVSRDGSSGGCIRLAVISESGTERILYTGDQVATLIATK